MFKKNKIIFCIVFLLGIISISLSVLYSLFFLPNILVTKKLYIKYGNTYKEIFQELKTDKVLKYPFTFDLAMRVLKVDKKIIRGAYVFQQGDTNWKVVFMLKKGLQRPIKFTISSAVDKEDFIRQVCDKLDIDYEKFKLLLADNDFLKEFGFNSENVLTLFIPNTYELYWTISEKDFFKRMYLEYNFFWNSTRLKKASDLHFSPVQVSILASIVHMETNRIVDAYKVARVYINRLHRRIPLCSDPTIKYAMLSVKNEIPLTIRRILKKDTHVKSPYNTYRNIGLPPGPLCMSSIAYIDAVLNCEEHEYLYFAGEEDFSGNLFFSKTLQKHNNHAKKYHKHLNSRNILR